MPASGTKKKNEELSSSEESRKAGNKDKKDNDKKEKKKAKKDEDVDSKSLPHPMDVGLGPVHLDVPVPASPPLSATAAGSAPASVPALASSPQSLSLHCLPIYRDSKYLPIVLIPLLMHLSISLLLY